MRCATIVPTKYLHLTTEFGYHMALAHLIGVDQPYTDHFIQLGQKGKFIIMDNGAAEDAQCSLDELIQKARLINASEIVLPDTIYDAAETLEKSREALIRLLDLCVPFRFMAVPQGRTFEEWLDCAREMMTWKVSTLGISKFVTPKYLRFKGKTRRACLEALMTLQCRKDIHFLGCWDDPNEVSELSTYETLNGGHTIRGADSAIAYAFARDGKLLTTKESRPMREIDFGGSDAEEHLLKLNILRWRDYCAGKLCELPQ